MVHSITKHKKRGEKNALSEKLAGCSCAVRKGARCRIVAMKRVIRKGIFYNDTLTNSESSQTTYVIGKRLPEVQELSLQLCSQMEVLSSNCLTTHVSFNPKLNLLIRSTIKMKEHRCVLVVCNGSNLGISFSASR